MQSVKSSRKVETLLTFIMVELLVIIALAVYGITNTII